MCIRDSWVHSKHQVTALLLAKAWEGRRAFQEHGHALVANNRGNPNQYGHAHVVVLDGADLPTRDQARCRSTGVLTRVFPPDLVDEVIAHAGRTEQRHRALPARVMAYFSIGMALYSEGSYEDVLSQLTDGLSWASGWQEAYSCL